MVSTSTSADALSDFNTSFKAKVGPHDAGVGASFSGGLKTEWNVSESNATFHRTVSQLGGDCKYDGDGKITSWVPDENSLRFFMPDTTVYRSGDSFDPSGLILKMTYNNGKESYVTENYTVNGYDNSKKGNFLLTASYMGCTASFLVEVLSEPGFDVKVYPSGKINIFMITPKDFEETAFALVALYKDGVMTDAFFGKAENGSELVFRSASEYDEIALFPSAVFRSGDS